MNSRTIHVIDVENLLEGMVTQTRTARLWHDYTSLAHPAQTDQFVAGFGPDTAAHGVFALPTQVRKLIGTRQADSADLALLADIDPAHITSRFQRVVIGSGDHIFTPAVIDLTRAGVYVTVMARPGCVSKRLLMAAHRFLPYPGQPIAHRLGRAS